MLFDFNKYIHNTAIVTENGSEVSYKELDLFSNELGEKIRERALIFSLCSNCLGAIVGYVSALKHDAVPLLLDKDIDSTLLSNLIDIYEPDYIYVPVERQSLFSYKTVFLRHGYALLETNIDHNKNNSLNSDLALLLTTSGSMGSPKLVRQSYQNIESNASAIVEYLGITKTDRAITLLPMNYTYGLSIINSHFSIGASVVLTNCTLMQKEFWALLQVSNVTSIAGVPYTYEMLDKLKFMRRDLPNLKTLTQAGGKLSLELHEKIARYAYDNNKRFFVMYGQTEATARMGYLPADKTLEKIGSMGIAIPGGKFSLIDENGNLINSPETAGELVYHGDNVSLGYASSRDDLSEGDDFKGRLLTGDVAKFDNDGFFYIIGRKKRFLKIYGNRVNLDETERLIKSNFKDIDCACCGIDDAMDIYITSNDCIQNVRDFVAKTSKINFSAFKVKYIFSLPKNNAGKILYSELGK
ncbi:AMP-binding protein [Pectobacterium actinidiae]|uniref:AMP-binding protein n=1 Tax=Pectobacterium actinidiae TaxID=1507808 RepID=UPI0023AB3E6C|nr:AMP-binding protein [Pectobacterium actinidiae]WEF10592.1 AMP-binding protein [Pectobacterium actinidiae]